MTPGEAEAFIRTHTLPARPAHVPEFQVFTATEITPIWQATEDFLRARNIAPPFWAFAWPGAQALARHILDHPATVRGLRVLDFAAGGGLAAIACARAGAAKVQANEIDPLAITAIRLNAALNGVMVEPVLGDLIGQAPAWDMIICGDICYEAPMTQHILPWLRHMAANGVRVWIADPGRAYMPKEGLTELALYEIRTTRELEDNLVRRTKIFTLNQALAQMHST